MSNDDDFKENQLWLFLVNIFKLMLAVSLCLRALMKCNDAHRFLFALNVSHPFHFGHFRCLRVRRCSSVWPLGGVPEPVGQEVSVLLKFSLETRWLMMMSKIQWSFSVKTITSVVFQCVSQTWSGLNTKTWTWSWSGSWWQATSKALKLVSSTETAMSHYWAELISYFSFSIISRKSRSACIDKP